MRTLWIIFGTYTASWGLWLLLPWTSFSSRAGIYDGMQWFMPEWGWGLHAFAIGCSILYGTFYHWPRGLMWGHIAGMYHWLLIAVFYLIGDWHNTGAITCIFISAVLHWAWLQSKKTNHQEIL